MAFPAQVFRVLIASPSDVSAEREVAVRAIQEWNDLNAAERRVVLLPLRWETHSAPVYGKRPQDVINRQVVDHCDLLVGIFWTRVGTPTGTAESGTVEEIERIANSGRPVMLYFSQAKQDPEKIDLDQLGRLREFKKKTFPKALVESYADHVEFKDKLAKQIEIQLRTLLAENAENESVAISPITDIVLHFADSRTGADLGSELTLQTRFFDVSGFDEIPDFISPHTTPSGATVSAKDLTSILFSSMQTSNTNKDFYRQKVTSLILQEYFRPVRFWLKNRGGVGARDIHIQVQLKGKKGQVILLSKSQLPSSQPSMSTTGYGLLSDVFPNSPHDLLNKRGEVWDTHIDVDALQPQRELSPSADFLIGSHESDEIQVSATIYADTLPEPIHQDLKIKIEVSKLPILARDIVDNVIQQT
ncbi:hypothetical protein [Noviherbaspirillum sp.]|uniref:hypothetical protein n=1 Tax=Noviherbaspirillum sp. TaxID=1926288 RepID=UPI0025D55941|nr:hypothetical protein [Noviherbaspirillum sp.]